MKCYGDGGREAGIDRVLFLLKTTPSGSIYLVNLSFSYFQLLNKSVYKSR